jgi:Kef-type K+ transport system membrane component KefB
MLVRCLLLTPALLCALPWVALAAESPADPVVRVAIALAAILFAAKIGGEIALRFGQAPIVGELLVGILLGNLELAGYSGLRWIETDPIVDLLAQLGVLLLLFEVGVEETVGRMLGVGFASLRVALLGVAAPFALGWAGAALLLPDAPPFTPVFVATILTATSVGITARVLHDLSCTTRAEARIILGAAVIDDILGLMVMSVVIALLTAADRGQAVSYGALGLTIGKATLFLVGSIVVGVFVTPRVFHAATTLRAPGVLLTLGLVFCFAMAWAASQVGLAPIIGAFTAGLILEGLHSRPYVDRGERSLSELLHPITSFLAPVFFVLMGMRTDLRALFADSAPLLALLLVACAILGKLVSGIGAPGPFASRLVVGIGMVPRGEVGLIFANLGLALTYGGKALLSPGVYSAVVTVVIVTTLVTPPGLAWALRRAP